MVSEVGHLQCIQAETQFPLLFSTTESANFNFYDCSENNSFAAFGGISLNWGNQRIFVRSLVGPVSNRPKDGRLETGPTSGSSLQRGVIVN